MLMLTSCLLLAALIQAPSYSIRGEVRGSDGKPAAGVSIITEVIDLQPDQARPRIRTEVSDSEGHFMVRVSSPGKYQLVYRDEENGYMPQSLPFFRDPNNSPPQVELTEAAPSAQVNISMSRNGTLTGMAIDAGTQLPIDNVTFVLCLADHRTPCWRTSRKSADGKFSVPAPFAPFHLMVSAAEFEPWGGVNGSDPEGQISIPSGTSLELKLLMKRKPEAINRAISEAEKRPGINLPAPQSLAPADNQVFDLFPRVTRLEWSRIDGAAWYAVEIDVCQGRVRPQCIDPQPLNLPTNLPTGRILDTSYEFRFVGAQPGRWRVWAVDNEGRDGFKSPWRTFVYLK